MVKNRRYQGVALVVAMALLVGCVSTLASCRAPAAPTGGSSTPTVGEDPQELLGTRFVSP
jgi:hypothetical protein